MEYVYVVLNRYTGFIYGVYSNKESAVIEESKRNNELGYETGQPWPARISTEPLLS